MFQFNYFKKVFELVKAKRDQHPRYNPEREGEEPSRVDARLASLFLTSIRRGYRSMPRTGSF
jgi:hypothetical protein